MCDRRSATPVASQFVMTASSSRGQLLPAFVTCCYISLRCHGMPCHSAVSICTLIANALVFVKCIDSHIHSSLSLLVAFMALWWDVSYLCPWMKVWGRERPWSLVGAFTNLGSWSTPDNHKSTARSCLGRFAAGLKRSSASLCFWCSKVWGGRKIAKCHYMVSLQ